MTPSKPDDAYCRPIDCFDPTKDDQCVFAYKTPHNDHNKLFSCKPGVEWTIDIYPKGTQTPAPVQLPYIPPNPPVPGHEHCSATMVYDSQCNPYQWINMGFANAPPSAPPAPATGQCQNPPKPPGTPFKFCRNWAIY